MELEGDHSSAILGYRSSVYLLHSVTSPELLDGEISDADSSSHTVLLQSLENNLWTPDPRAQNTFIKWNRLYKLSSILHVHIPGTLSKAESKV